MGFGGAGPSAADGPSPLPSRAILVQNVILVLGWGLPSPSQADVNPRTELRGVRGVFVAGRVLITEACSLGGRGLVLSGAVKSDMSPALGSSGRVPTPNQTLPVP